MPNEEYRVLSYSNAEPPTGPPVMVLIVALVLIVADQRLRACTVVFPFMYCIMPYTVLMPTPLLQQIAILAVACVHAFAG